MGDFQHKRFSVYRMQQSSLRTFAVFIGGIKQGDPSSECHLLMTFEYEVSDTATPTGGATTM